MFVVQNWFLSYVIQTIDVERTKQICLAFISYWLLNVLLIRKTKRIHNILFNTRRKLYYKSFAYKFHYFALKQFLFFLEQTVKSFTVA